MAKDEQQADIVTRLRAQNIGVVPLALLEEAAGEIERLRLRLKRRNKQHKTAVQIRCGSRGNRFRE